MTTHFHRQGHKTEDGTRASTRERLAGSMRLVWTIIGIGVLVIACGFIVGSIATAIWTLVAAGIVVFILRRPVRWLAQKGWPRGIAAGVLLILLIAAIIAIVISFVPMIVEQMAALANALPGYISQAQSWWGEFTAEHPELLANDTAKDLINTIGSSVLNFISSIPSTVVTGIYQAGLSIANLVMYGIMAFLVAFWILLDYDRMAREVHILAGDAAEWYLLLISTIFSRVLGGFLRGTIITAIVIAVVSGIGYMIAGLPFAMVLGILMGLFSIVPYLGPVIAAVIVAILAIFSGPVAFFISLAVSIVVPWVASSFVSPKIMSSTVNLHPGIIMVAIIAGGALAGIVGMIFAVPITAAAKCLIVYFFEAITGRQLVSNEGAVFSGNPTDMIDPVADATDNFLNSEKLRAMVEEVERDVRKVEHSHALVPAIKKLAHPMEYISAQKAEDAGIDEADEEAAAPAAEECGE